MCGIAGIVTFGGSLDARASRRRVEQMLRSLAHRGPDGSGMTAANRAVIGARRLSIRGLADGTQPFVDAQSGVITVCNGEIDNHRDLRAWLSARGRNVSFETDVAVIPGLYLELGASFVERLEGAFALAVYDPRDDTLLLARDRAGERPLFYAFSRGTITFASEIGALASDPHFDLTPDSNALQEYLRSGWFAAPTSPFAAVKKLAPATVLKLDAHGAHERRYWRFALVESEKRTPREDEFDAILRAAVRRQGDVDVPLGLFLSGGLDSSLIAALARAEWPHKALVAYTLRFAESSYDEGRFAERAARELHLDRVDVDVRADDVPPTLAALVRGAGEPLADPAWVPSALLARRASADVKVALVGEGADEVLGGYPTYVGAWLAEAHARLPGPLQRTIASLVQALPDSEKKVTISFLLKRFVESARLPGLQRHREWTAAIPARELGRLQSPEPGTRGSDVRESGEELDGLLLDRLQRFDFEMPLAEGLLTKADRSSMAAGLELRAPFLDPAVLEFAAHLPARDRVRSFRTKAFLKQYALGHLPREIVLRRKRGLSVPLGTWLRGPLREWARGRLASARLEVAGLSTDRVLDWFDEHAERRADHARGLSALLALAEWCLWVDELQHTRDQAEGADVILVPFTPTPQEVRSSVASESPLSPERDLEETKS